MGGGKESLPISVKKSNHCYTVAEYLPLSPCVFWFTAINSLASMKESQKGVCQSSRPKLNYSNLAFALKYPLSNEGL